MAPADDRGATLPDMLAALALMALVSATTLPVVAGALDHERAMLGAQFVAARTQYARLEALRRGAFVALRVTLLQDDAEVQAFVDGNGNGVLTRDIERGLDPPVEPPDRLSAHMRGVSLRVNQRVPDIGGSGWIETDSNPLRLGRTSLLSFSPTGSATAGTLYMSARRGPQLAVRVTGATGRVRVLRFNEGARLWLP
ncbi:MAG: GspH/FimT family pseudopilin [Acidobacteria bacterium]|nr:GspH/FimT family pseudopilin [Acidobacteriota bacterium]